MSSEQKWLVAGIAGFLLLCLCIGVACVALGGLAALGLTISDRSVEPGFEATRVITVEAVPLPATPAPATTQDPQDPGPTPDGTQTVTEPVGPPAGSANETLFTIENEVIPENDPRDLARRLEGKHDIPETIAGEPEPLDVGAVKSFWVTNTDTNEKFQVSATLQYETDHLYFWVENRVQYNHGDLERLAETFEQEIYPTNREFFGSEWTPGIDNDPHLYVLYVSDLGRTVAGYFSSGDSVHPDASQYSNAHETFVLNADNIDLADEYTYATMAHEFQHMIHWYRDRNEENWLNEGFAELAQLLNGYSAGGSDFLYISDPDLQLNHWPSSPDSHPHYGASFLFVAYFLDRFSEEATKAVVAHPDNGMDSIDQALAEINATDPVTGQPVTADDVFSDWVITNYLNDPDVGDGRFVYRRYTEAMTAGDTEEVTDCSSQAQERTVRQYGVDYIRIRCSGSFTLHFEGDPEVRVLSADTEAGNYAFWSNRSDESDMTLTREFDFTQASGSITFTYRTWYDLEEDYDYLYLLASENGEDWEILRTPSGTGDDPSGNSYGWGYNGASGDWIEESVDLSQFAGKRIQLRFEYITDAAVNGEGLLLDDLRIEAIGYSEDFEAGEGGWQGDGFVRIQNRLPQKFRISIIREGRTTTVETVALEAGQTASIPLDLGEDVQEAVLVVSGVTRFTTQPARYRFSFSR